jgi:hypothetical protein
VPSRLRGEMPKSVKLVPKGKTSPELKQSLILYLIKHFIRTKMKTTLLIATFALLFGTTRAQHMKTSAVPSAVTAKFATLYPKAEEVKWEKEGANYEAEFEINEVETSASFDAAGTFLESEVEVNKTSLPASVMEYMNKNAAGAKVKEVSKITDASGKVTWEVESGKLDYIFDESGTFIKTEKGD